MQISAAVFTEMLPYGRCKGSKGRDFQLPQNLHLWLKASKNNPFLPAPTDISKHHSAGSSKEMHKD